MHSALSSLTYLRKKIGRFSGQQCAGVCRNTLHYTLKSNTHRRRDETVESRRVGGVNTPPIRVVSVNTPVASRDPVYNFLC